MNGAFTFGREKRLLLGIVALLAPLPLPFNEVLGWGWYLLYAACVAAYLVRARRDPPGWVPIWLANVLAIVYLPFLGFDLLVLSGGHAVGPVVRLGLFAVLVKLWSLRRERDKWHAVLGIFFLFLAAMATSVHLSVVLYLLLFLAAGLLMLTRFALLHLVAGFGQRQAAEVHAPVAGFLALCCIATVLLAIPLFAVLPRVSTPYISAGGGRGTGAEVGVSGFSDEVTLDTIGRIRTSRDVALRLTYEGVEPPDEIRLKGGAFDRFDHGAWRPAADGEDLQGAADRRLDLVGGRPPVGWVEIWRQPMSARGLPLPVETVQVEVPWRSLHLDRGGALRMRNLARTALAYRAGLGPRPRSVAPPPVDDPAAPTLDLGGVTPRMVDLAERLAAEAGPDAAARASALEDYLSSNYDYTLDRLGSDAESPLDDFLFVHRSGHCEYFASAMVLLLRAEGIHARLVAGFLGGEETPLGYVLVRQSNAHAWVEAYVPGDGWRIYDPTPPAGRPAQGEQGLAGLAGQLYDTLVFQWDRYVLTYGVEDQMDFLYAGMRSIWSLLHRLRGGDDGAPDAVATTDAGTAQTAAQGASAAAGAEAERRVLTAALLLFAAVLALLLWRRYRDPLTATRAYRTLRRQLAAAGLRLSDATGPLALEERAAGRFPSAAVPAGQVVRLYLRESFGGEELGEAERGVLVVALEEARRAVRRAR